MWSGCSPYWSNPAYPRSPYTSPHMKPFPAPNRLKARLLLLFAAAAWAALLARPALAQEGGFRVAAELIVFLQLKPEASTEDLAAPAPDLPPARTYPAPLMLPDPGATTPPPPPGVLALTRAQFAMDGIWTVMRRSADYRPLAHFAWAMPAEWDGQPARLRLSTLSAAALPFSGLASLQEDRFAHLALDLRLPDATGSGDEFRIHERRRLLLGETHYFDHPRFGAVARLFRYRDRPQPETRN